ncbi:MAG TPA: hypothetical protein VFE54_06095 [Mucilaginibacter sp.]|nr:hypothetical protein [Mucilaginibacter sp.]
MTALSDKLGVYNIIMTNPKTTLKPFHQLSSNSVLAWRIVQIAVWLVGAAILFCLLFFPSVGIILFWNILIPVAPALVVVFTGLWRNICPLATTNLLPRHFGLSKRKKLSAKQMGIFSLISVIALYAIVPLRHSIFNVSGMATAILIISIATVSVIVGFIYEWKSAWCSGLCPIHPVEKLYGGNTLMALPNAHCDQCMNCTVPCPDSTPNINPASSTKTTWHRISGLLIIGGLPGFIWGWFHVPDALAITGFSAFISVYKMPMIGFAITLAVYGILSAIIQRKYERKLIGFFAASGVSCYYWYRIPSLLGFGNFGHDGLLVNLSNVLPQWSIYFMMIASVSFFFYWLAIRVRNKKSWLIRPEFAKKRETLREKLSA